MDENEPNDLIKIGDLAKCAGVTVRTIRYYEELGLISPTKTSPGGFRLYTKLDLRKLLFVKRFKELGFSLDDIKELFRPSDGETTKKERISASLTLLEEQLSQVNDKIKKLTSVKEEVEMAVKAKFMPQSEYDTIQRET